MAQLGGVPIIILKEGTESVKGNSARNKNIQAIQAVGLLALILLRHERQCRARTGTGPDCLWS